MSVKVVLLLVSRCTTTMGSDMNNEQRSNEKAQIRFLTEADKHAIWDVARWVADEGPRDLWLLVDTIVGQHLARVIPPGESS